MSILDFTYQYSNIVWTFPPPITFTAVHTQLKTLTENLFQRSSSLTKKIIKSMTISSPHKLHKFITCTYLSIKGNFLRHAKICNFTVLNPYTPRVKALIRHPLGPNKKS